LSKQKPKEARRDVHRLKRLHRFLKHEEVEVEIGCDEPPAVVAGGCAEIDCRKAKNPLYIIERFFV
jgi:hypothetical protein